MRATVLIIDDSELVRSRVRDVLQKGGVGDTFVLANDGASGFKLLLERRFDLVLCDILMPGIDGFKLLAMKRARPELDEIPVILLSGDEDVNDKVRGLEAGASDYVTKPFHEAELVARARVHLRVKLLTDELRTNNRSLERQSRTDPLTNIANRRGFMEVFERELDRIRRYGGSLGLVMIDIDHFKDVNDKHGHLTGDEVLVAITSSLDAELRSSDLLGRYGGEELAILLVESDAAKARSTAERCRKRIENLDLNVAGERLRLTASFGVVAFPEKPATSVDDLIKLADDALYRAKQGGRNRVASA
jgi:two-component system, cell cycle response regulator